MADWSCSSTFQKLYYKPVFNSKYCQTVLNHSRVLGNLSVFRIIFSELLFLKCLLLHVSDIKVVLPGLSLGVEIYLVYSHIFLPSFAHIIPIIQAGRLAALV